MKVLLVDDDCSLLEGKFRSFPAEMLYAVNEEEANAILAKNSVEAILMDGYLDLIGDLDGADVVRRLRASGVTTNIVMFSSDDTRNEDGIAAGANGSWNKKMMREEGWEDSLINALT